jgi:hypothetical protein
VDANLAYCCSGVASEAWVGLDKAADTRLAEALNRPVASLEAATPDAKGSLSAPSPTMRRVRLEA